MNIKKIRVSVAGGSGYTGGELIRLLLNHPFVNIVQVTSESKKGKAITKAHPNLRNHTRLKFSSIEDLEKVDVLFLGLPHGYSSKNINYLQSKSDIIIDKSGDFRLNNPEQFTKYYGSEHPEPEWLKSFVYGLPELHREEIINSTLIAAPGCNATATILGLYPLYKNGLVKQSNTVVEVKAGSSQGGIKNNPGSHHPERSGVLRMYKPHSHRHAAEIQQELKTDHIHFSAISVELVRGVSMTAHTFLSDSSTAEKDIWSVFREVYGEEPFIRIIRERSGNYRLPEPKILAGTNMCDIGFVVDPESNRLIVMSAIDNLMKGAAGQAIQCMNIVCNFQEETGLDFIGLHPV